MSEPVEYQMRMRPTWESTSFSDWKKCSRDDFDDYTKTPKLHEWEYEVRKLYTSPPAQEFVCSTGLCHYKPAAQRPWVGLTNDEVRKINQEVWGYVSADHTRMRGYAYAIESKLKDLNT